MSGAIEQPTFKVTGRLVLACLFGFFGVVFAVNGVLVYAAKSTFGGLETASSYKAGLQFNRDIATAREQAALHWQISGHVARNPDGEAVLTVRANDQGGMPLSGLTAAAKLAHPADARLDREIDLSAAGAGVYRGKALASAGQWELVIDFYRGGERVFRSMSRVILK